MTGLALLYLWQHLEKHVSRLAHWSQKEDEKHVEQSQVTQAKPRLDPLIFSEPYRCMSKPSRDQQNHSAKALPRSARLLLTHRLMG